MLQRSVVSSSDLAIFLELVESGDFHAVARRGETLLKPGQYIPDYAVQFKAFPAGRTKNGQIRYDLMQFKGTAGAGGVLLFLKEDTGEIVQFLPFEATF
jgi:hypothetical protein